GLNICNGLSDWWGFTFLPLRYIGEGSNNCIFGRTIVINQTKRKGPARVSAQLIATRQQNTEAKPGRKIEIDEAFRNWCRKKRNCDPMVDHPKRQFLGRSMNALVRNPQTRTRGQGRPHLPDRRIECRAGVECRATLNYHLVLPIVPAH